MKYLRQLFIILTMTFIGESLNKLLPLPIPAGVYGLFILLVCLQMKWISLESISGAGNFLLEIMPIMFIPASVGLITIYARIADQIVFLIITVVLSTIVVAIITGKIAQIIVSRKKRKKSGV